MNNITKIFAGYASVAVFFFMAIIGLFCGHEPSTCCQRAVIGAILTYIIIKLAARLIYRVIVSAIVDDQVKKQMAEQEKRDN